MKRTLFLGILGGLSLAASAGAQQAPATAQPPATGSSPAPSTRTSARPDANYPNPSGQDSLRGVTTPKRAAGSSPDYGTVQSQGSRPSNQSGQVKHLAKQPAYKGNTGKKKDPGTACNTARPAKNGGVDCGLGGSGARPGKVVPKP